jgi:thiosulfate/3-mercaptopyruvate sulfurtransferase
MAKLELPAPLVSVAWLREQLGHEDLVIFDASWHMPATGRDGLKEWQQEHIPGARFFDFDGKIRDPDADLPHMMPDEETFTRELRALGLNQRSCVVVYDTMGMFSSPRAWWMLRAMGCENLALLDGGLVAWNKAGYPVDSCQEAPSYASGDFSARFSPGHVADAAAVLTALDDESICVLDARPEPRFRGSAEEPRPGLRSGHMPGALNLPFAYLFHDGLFKSKSDLEQLLKPLVGDSSASICSCGSGVTACIIAFALHYIGDDRFAVYDGSWCEWGLPGDLPVVVDD